MPDCLDRRTQATGAMLLCFCCNKKSCWYVGIFFWPAVLVAVLLAVGAVVVAGVCGQQYQQYQYDVKRDSSKLWGVQTLTQHP